MKLPQPQFEAIWIKRYKRFLLDVELAIGGTATAHCPNSGSMAGCGAPGSRVILSHHPEPHRKLEYTLELVRVGRSWVGVNTQHPNRIVEEAIGLGKIEELSDFKPSRREVTYGNSRFDLEIEDGRGAMLVEVKNVTLVQGRTAMFPDAVTARGGKHVAELARAAGEGRRAAVFFLVQRPDADSFSPADHIDSAFGDALRAAADAGVRLLCYNCSVTPRRVITRDKLQIDL